MVLWVITGFATAVGITRFIFGLGSVTNLTDATPWGLWIGFDVMAGVALASGGFVMTAIFYVMKRQEFQSLIRPAILTAFLGYLAVILGLTFDVGLPWNLWHLTIYWNFHSPLFEVGWCVMLYTAVLLLEFSPVPLEETSRYAWIRTFLLKFRFPLVLLGIMLSTLHQSSLGSLFLIMPFKLHGLWYSDTLPIQFFISAVALGLMMVSLESLVSHWLYKRKAVPDLVAKLGRIATWVLLFYLVVKLADIAVSDELGMLVSGTWESALFILEILMSVIIPVIIFSIPRWRNSTTGQWIGSSLVVLGMIFNRINVGGLTMLRVTGDTYIPSWMEISISLGVVSAAVLVFLLAVEELHIWKQPPVHPEAGRYARPEFDYTSRVWLGNPGVTARTKYSLAFILSLAIGFALIPDARIHSRGVMQTIAQKPRGGMSIYIDGNRDRYGVEFDHTRHADTIISRDSCAICHHMNRPLDNQSGCWECHQYMYSVTDVFGHDRHSSPGGANISCRKCHQAGERREESTAAKCEDCHLDLIPAAALIAVDEYMAPSYTSAMHKLCIDCHKKKAAEMPERQHLPLCTACHKSVPPEHMQQKIKDEFVGPYFNRVMIPGQSLDEKQD
jgi:Ni/Fe-hydrogenase subunit HybB-like protein